MAIETTNWSNNAALDAGLITYNDANTTYNSPIFYDSFDPKTASNIAQTDYTPDSVSTTNWASE